jgi:kynureninase
MTQTQIEALDRSDPLARKRDEFLIPEELIYLDGNSLGVLPKRVLERIGRTVQQEWGQDLIRSWNKNGWMNLPQSVGQKIARLIGAKPDEVIAADTTSVNLFKVLLAAIKLRPERRVIVSDIDNFPTDLYIAQGVKQLLGEGYELRFVNTEELGGAIDPSCAVLMLTQVNYRTGYLYDMAGLTKTAHQHGALTIWDLSHSTGAFQVELNACGADFAVGCGYKYLNGGPGAPAYLYVAKEHQNQAIPFMAGWMGHKTPFAFDPWYVPTGDIRHLTVGTPHILSLSALDAALDVFADVDMQELRRKSLKLTGLFIELMQPLCAQYDFRLATPTPEFERGSQVSYTHPQGYAIMQALIAAGVIGDFRAPDFFRFGFTPLYLRYTDVVEAVKRIARVMREEQWKKAEHQQRAAVT